MPQAGNPSLLAVAQSSGLSLSHLAAVERGEHPLLDTDARDLGAVFDVPSSWLRHGWAELSERRVEAQGKRSINPCRLF